jgi:hypothetical protein
MNSRKVAILVALILCVFAISRVEACSVCRCGDNAFQFSDRGFALADQSETHRFGLNFDNILSSKSAALSGDEGPGTERQREIRPSIRISYSILENLSFALDTPFQMRRITTSRFDGISRDKSSGLGDMELSSVWMQNIWSNDGTFYSAGISMALKLPTGDNKITAAGERIDEHLQAGTGAFDWQLGTALSRVTCASRYFTSLYYRRNGTNDFKYHYGNAMLFNFGGQWPITDRLAGVVQINGRYAARDLDNKIETDNTGGWVTYITPGLRIFITDLVAISSYVQIPAYQKLYGNQSEKTVIKAGLSFQL